MHVRETPLGTLKVATREEIFAELVSLFRETVANGQREPTIALTGGSTPKAFYQWAVETGSVDADALHAATWCVSDERYVPLESEESNFGNAARQFLDPLRVPNDNRFPWPVHVDPHSGAELFNRIANERWGIMRAFDLCLLGMGEDTHTASLFPGSPIIGAGIRDHFACVEVPEKGWRFTITPNGLRHCGKVVAIITGEAKAEPLKTVLTSKIDRVKHPIQNLAEVRENTVLFVDEAAAAKL